MGEGKGRGKWWGKGPNEKDTKKGEKKKKFLFIFDINFKIWKDRGKNSGLESDFEITSGSGAWSRVFTCVFLLRVHLEISIGMPRVRLRRLRLRQLYPEDSNVEIFSI